MELAGPGRGLRRRSCPFVPGGARGPRPRLPRPLHSYPEIAAGDARPVGDHQDTQAAVAPRLALLLLCVWAVSPRHPLTRPRRLHTITLRDVTRLGAAPPGCLDKSH